jgi:NAD(P)-dependent dehydrogenase (short-subunit alcohol dehydrogenase family)
LNVLITGANRGIGLGFVEHYLKQGADVFACYRQDQGGLSTISDQRLHLVQWDVTQESSAGAAAGQIPDALDLLVNNAGIYGPKGEGQSLQRINADIMHEVFDVDCVAAIRVVQALWKQVANGGGVIANVSSKMGSSADNSSGGCYAYRAAKAALLICSKSMAVDLAPFGIHVISLHPGWVRTDMTAHSGLCDVTESVAGMTTVIGRARSYPAGSFVAYDGQIVPF